MDGNIDTVREGVEGLLEAANHNVGGMVPGVIATWCHKALSTLSSIDPEAIRAEVLREAADRAVSWQVALCKRDDWHCESCTECNQLRYIIMGNNRG